MHLQWVNYFLLASTPFREGKEMLCSVNIGVKPDFSSSNTWAEPNLTLCITEVHSRELNHESCFPHHVLCHIHVNELIYPGMLHFQITLQIFKELWQDHSDVCDGGEPTDTLHWYKLIDTLHSWLSSGSKWPYWKVPEPCFQCSSKEIGEGCIYILDMVRVHSDCPPPRFLKWYIYFRS